MSEHIFDRQEREWQDHLEQSRKAKQQQIEDEWLIRNRFGFTDEELPPEWLGKIQRDRDAFEKERGIQGRQRKEIADRQEQERKQELARFQQDTQPEQKEPDTGGYNYTNEDMEKMY